MIEFSHLSKNYGEVEAVRDLELSIEKGEVFGFLGPNGAGKTTTIRMMMGILVPSTGRILIDGLDCQRDRVEVKRHVGYLPDNPIFYDYLRGREILAFVGEMHGQSRGEAERRASALLGDFALDDAAEEYAVNYSTGMKKKLGLACALIHDPPVLILDEPTIGLDPRQIIEIRSLIRTLGGKRTVVLSTHILPEVSQVCDKVVIINDGRIVVEDTLANLTRGRTLEDMFIEAITRETGDGARALAATES